MELITILNRCHRFGSFVYQHAHFSADKKSIEVAVRPRKGSAALAAKLFLQSPLRSAAQIRPRVIHFEGHQAYAHAVAELKRSG
jgi:hypothetical protein